MIDFMRGCFDLLFDLLSSGSFLVWLPFCTLIFSVLFCVTVKFIRGDIRG